jgi:hypothetical protein
MLGLLIIVAVFGLAVAAFAYRTRTIVAHTVAEIAASDWVLPGELGAFVSVLNSTSSESDAEYLSGVARLREHKDEVLAEAARVMARPPEGLFALRHSVILAVSALRDAGALDLLSKVALNPQPLPPRQVSIQEMTSEHDVEAVVQGTMIALDAVDGIEGLADDGHAAALDVLVEATRVNSNAIRGAALTALAARDERRDHFQQALSSLPAELRPLAGLRRMRVQDVPQIGDPRVHLAGEERMEPAAPLLPGDMPDQMPRSAPGARGAPLIRRR